MREKIKFFLKSLTDNQIVDIWNSYCDATNNSERYIFYMREINDFFEGEQTPFEIMYKMYPYINEGLFNPSDDYFRIDPIGNYYSAELPSDLVCCIYDTLENFIITRKQDFGIAAIAEIIKEEE